MDLHHRVALVTGTRRIGQAVADALAAGGADVALAYHRSKDEAEAAAARVRALGRRAIVAPCDVSDAGACRALIANVDRELGRLDVLVNMASVYRAVPYDDVDEAVWRKQIGVDLDGTFHCSRAAVPIMRRGGGGRIINVSDWVAASARPRYKGYLAYYVAKAGVKAFSEALALEVARDGILVNTIAPGPILAPPGTTAEELEAVIRATPLGRWGGAEEIAKTVVALVQSDFITGETIRVDGGRHLY